MEKALKYARGTIWSIDNFLNQVEQGVQSGRRPCVIISNDMGNASNDSVIVAMITSKLKTNVMVNVPFVNVRGEENVVLCNQIHTVSKKWLKDPMLGILNSETMKKIDKALALSLEITILNQTGIQLDNEFIQRLLLNITRNNVITVSDQKQEGQEKQEATAVEVVEQTKSTAKPVEKTKKMAEPVKKLRKSKKSQDIVNELLGNTNKETAITDKPAKTTDTKKGTKKVIWNNDTKLQFIVDVDSSGYDAAMQKWNIKSRATALSYYCKFKKELDIKTERQKRQKR